MNRILKNKSLLVVVIGFVLAIAGLVYVMRQPVNPLLLAEFQNHTYASEEGAALLQLLQEMNALELNHEVLESPVFKSLDNNEIDIPTPPLGHENPFSSQR